MSDSIARETVADNPRFLSLKWKSLATLFCILSTLLMLLSWHFYERFQREYRSRLTELRLHQLEELEKSIYRSGEQLYQLIDATVITPLQSQVDISEYRQRLHQVLPKYAQLWNIQEVALVKRDNTTFEHLPVNLQQPKTLTTWLSASGIQKLSNTNISTLCLPACVQVLNFPIIQDNDQIATLLVSRNMRAAHQDFFNKTRTHVAVLKSPLTTVANELHTVPFWDGELITNFNDNSLPGLLQAASKHFKSGALLGSNKSFSYQGKTYAISFMPIRGYEDLSLRYILLRDFSGERQALVENIIGDMAIIFCSIAIFAIYTIMLIWHHFGRVKQQTEVLPLLSQKQFSKARDIIRKNRRHNLFRDELDILDETVTIFSHQLESLEETIGLRTREMEQLSLFDTLTGLANRNLLLYELQCDVRRFKELGGILAIAILDLDKFKRINDSVGHQMGDMVLGKIGARLKNATRSLGLVARPGGDEFAIILRSTKKIEHVELLCQKIIELIRRPLELDGNTISISCSMGVTVAGTEESDHDVIRHAEIAMYKAKEAGGNAYRMFDPNMAADAHTNLSLEADIRRAFENKEFTLFLQPKVNMEKHIVGFEALIRWDHPERGLVPPVEFIPAMENMGLINELDNFVLEVSCRQLQVLQKHYPEISIAINISSIHFTDKNFLVFLKSCLNKYPIDPSRLELEITETLLMENMNVGLQVIEQIKALGVSIAIDDFGTGYSSLSYLKKLPVDTIKIDREFIKDIPESESDMQISSVIIFLAKQLNFTVVAEGVETTEQLVFLKANQCDLAQGYLFSKPIPAHQAMLLLESRSGERNNKIING